MYGWIGLNYMMISKMKHKWFNVHVHFPFEHVMQGREIQDKHCKNCLSTVASSNCNLENALESSSLFLLLFVPLPGVVFLDRFDLFFLKKTIQYQGSLHLIFIMKINRLHKQATCKRKQSKRRFILVVSRSPYLTKSWFPWVLEMCFLCCLISLWAYLLKQQIVCSRKQSLCKKETHQPFLKININFVCEKISYDGSVSNHFRLLGDILVTKCWKLLTVG